MVACPCTPLSNYRDEPWVLVSACLECAVEVDQLVATPLPASGSLAVRQLLGKLRCQRCGQAPTGVLLQSLPTNTPGSADMMVLVGPGAFA
nr:hypothetical protein [uncultured Lichenicoccus sp.]